MASPRRQSDLFPPGRRIYRFYTPGKIAFHESTTTIFLSPSDFMTPRLRITSVIASFALLLILITGCTSDDAESPEPGQLADTGAAVDTDTDDADTGPTVDADAEADSDHTEPSDVDPDADSGEFRKPEESEAIHAQTTLAFPPHEESYPRTTRSGPGARPHMAATRVAMESWLYPGEYFVIDEGVVQHNMWWLPSDYYFIAVHEGERLPLHVIDVGSEPNTPYPSMEEIEELDEDDFDDVAVVERDNSVPFHYTVVIPPWAFSEEGAYNIQIFDYPVWEPFPGAPSLSMKPNAMGSTSRGRRHNTHTIYYGDTEFVSTPDDIDDRQDQASTWESTEPGPFIVFLNFMYLTPPEKLCDWLAPDTAQDASCVSEELVSPDKEVTLEMYVAGVEDYIIRADTRGENLYYVMRDDEIIDKFLLDVGETDFAALFNEEDKGLVLPIDIELTESPAAYQILTVPEPFTPTQSGESPNLLRGNLPIDSNTLIMRYDPDK